MNTKPTYKRFDTYTTPDFTDHVYNDKKQDDNSVVIDVKEEVNSKKKKDEESDDDDDDDDDVVEDDVEDPYGYDDGLHVVDPAAPDPLPTSKFGKFQYKLKKVLEHFAFRLFSLLLIIIDICILIVELAKQNDTDHLKAFEITSLCFVTYFVIEIILRIIAWGPKEFIKDWLNVIDLVIVLSAFIITILTTISEVEKVGTYKLVVAGRLIRIVLFVRLYTAKKNVEKGARKLVSQNKRRYQKDGFDLDLTYVTERVIAMSFPSAGRMSVYRNPIKEVARFLNTKHPNNYKVYNMCSERTYDDSFFHGRVEQYLIDDHNVPLVKDMLRFTKSVATWFSSNPNNVIAVHCKGGKGRTGTMICIWLVESGLFESAGDSLDYFGYRRTDLSMGSKFQGVETPSQSRYVGYYEYVKDKLGGKLPSDVPLKMVSFKITALAGLGKGDGSDFGCEVFTNRNNKVFECNFGLNRNCEAKYYNEGDYLLVKLVNCPILVGDVKMKFQSSTRGVPRGYEKVPFYFWFHTSFIEDGRLLIKRNDLDNPHKQKTWQWFREKFSIEITFSDPKIEGNHQSTNSVVKL